MAPPSAQDLEKLEQFGRDRGVQIFLQPGGLDSVRALRDDYPPLDYRVDDGRVVIEFGPVDFVQVNRQINASMVDAAIELLAPQAADSLLDLFCGLGNFTLPLARRTQCVTGRGGRCGTGGQGALQCSAQPDPQCGLCRRELVRTGQARRLGRGALRLGVDGPATGRRHRNTAAFVRLAAAPSRVYFLSSGEFGAGCRHFSEGFRIHVDPRRSNGHVSAHDARRIHRGLRENCMSLGPLMVDLAGLSLTPEDVEVLKHPLVGSVILFSRNYQDVAQVTALTAAVRALRSPHLLIAVDHEGGRVQRFREGFTRLPAARLLGRRFDEDRREGLDLAQSVGWLMASELRAVGVDFSFAPCVDLDYGVSEIIGDRVVSR